MGMDLSLSWPLVARGAILSPRFWLCPVVLADPQPISQPLWGLVGIFLQHSTRSGGCTVEEEPHFPISRSG